MTPYFPFLKAKRGEYRALVALDSDARRRLVPVLELLPAPPPRERVGRPPQSPRTMDQQVSDHVRQIADSSATCHSVLVDFTYLPDDPTGDRKHPAEVIMSRLRSMGVKASPIVRPSASLGLISALNTANCVEDGMALRLSPTDFDYPPERIDVILSSLHVGVEAVDAIVDFGPIADAGALQRGTMRAALTVQGQREWRSLSIGGASFPSSLSEFEEGSHRLPRLEWAAWCGVDLPDRPIGFADYGMRHPSPPVEGGVSPIPNLRYTDGDDWLVLKAKASESRFYEDLAWELTHTASVWRGASHCDGCAAIARCAGGDKGKTAEQAIQFGMTHHLTCVTQQLASSVADAASS